MNSSYIKTTTCSPAPLSPTAYTVATAVRYLLCRKWNYLTGRNSDSHTGADHHSPGTRYVTKRMTDQRNTRREKNFQYYHLFAFIKQMALNIPPNCTGGGQGGPSPTLTMANQSLLTYPNLTYVTLFCFASIFYYTSSNFWTTSTHIFI